jgi:GTP-binding protein LepA
MIQNNIRNFCIIAHVDHGKSTLADRMLEITGTVPLNKMKPQMLDRNPIERERGITIKLQPVRMNYRLNNEDYILNLIDTPGHVDFSYEVSRSLAAVEGAILLVDATQGVQAQTLANLASARKQNLNIIPVINKIDLPNAQPEKVAIEVAKLLKVLDDEIIFASGKTGEGVEDILNAVINRIKLPSGEVEKPLRALIFDSVYDRHRGVVVFTRIVDGQIKSGQGIRLIESGAIDISSEIGIFNPDQESKENLSAGEIGYVVTGLKDIRNVRVGDTLTVYTKGHRENESISALPGYKLPKPMVYASMFPMSPGDYPLLRDAIFKYVLTDGALDVEPESSQVLGFGYRLGFLGLLHVDIVSERLTREYDLSLLITTPHVQYKIVLMNNEVKVINSIGELPERSKYKDILEPWAHLEILVPSIYLGKIIELVQSHRSTNVNPQYLDDEMVLVKLDIPLAELIVHFYDELKSVSSGYASMSYEIDDFRAGELVRLDIKLSDNQIDALSAIVPQEFLQKTAKEKVEKLRELVPKQQFEVKIQAVVGSHVIASERIGALRKDVTAKLYGGDVTRKNKLLDKQKKGKQRLKRFGKVDLPSDVFLQLLKQ